MLCDPYLDTGGMAVEPKKLAEIYDYIMKHSLEDVITEMKQK